MPAMIKSDAESGMHVSNRGIVEIHTAFRHMSGDPASVFPVAGWYPTRGEFDLG